MRQRISRNSKSIHVTMQKDVKVKLEKYAKRNDITLALALEKILSLFFHAEGVS